MAQWPSAHPCESEAVKGTGWLQSSRLSGPQAPWGWILDPEHPVSCLVLAPCDPLGSAPPSAQLSLSTAAPPLLCVSPGPGIHSAQCPRHPLCDASPSSRKRQEVFTVPALAPPLKTGISPKAMLAKGTPEERQLATKLGDTPVYKSRQHLKWIVLGFQRDP